MSKTNILKSLFTFIIIVGAILGSAVAFSPTLTKAGNPSPVFCNRGGYDCVWSDSAYPYGNKYISLHSSAAQTYAHYDYAQVFVNLESGATIESSIRCSVGGNMFMDHSGMQTANGYIHPCPSGNLYLSYVMLAIQK